jgi:signal transduction histidine kinase
MNINGLIDTNYRSVPDLKDIKDLTEAFVENDYLAVLNEELKTVGILTLKDIFHHRSGMIRDCDILKPHVGPDHGLEDVIQLMKQAGTDHLPVYETTDFKGIVSLLAVAEKLMRTLTESRLNYQKVIHDVRNPISNLKGLVNLLSEEENHAENLDTIKLCDLSCDHALSILEDLLYVETDEVRPLNKQTTEMSAFFRQCINEQKGLGLQKRIVLQNGVSDETIIKNVDRNLIKRAVHNIISNAVKFSHPNSTIKVSSKVEEGKLILKIVDSGVGIPPHLQKEIFTKFSAAQRTGTSGEASTGLGLVFTKQCIERHGGELTFKSIEGRGTKFYIKL